MEQEKKDAVTSSHARASVRPLAVTQLVIGMAVYPACIRSGNGKWLYDLQNKRPRISSAGNRTHRIISRTFNFTLLSLHLFSCFHVVTDQLAEYNNIYISGLQLSLALSLSLEHSKPRTPPPPHLTIPSNYS